MSAALKLKEIKNKVKSKYLLYYSRSRYPNVFNKKAALIGFAKLIGKQQKWRPFLVRL